MESNKNKSLLKKVLKILIVLSCAFAFYGCNLSEDVFPFNIFKKQIDIINNFEDVLNSDEIETTEDIDQQEADDDEQQLTGLEVYEHLWYIYASNGQYILQISNTDIEIEESTLACSGIISEFEDTIPWKEYDYDIATVIVGTEDKTFNVWNSMKNWFCCMNGVQKIKLYNVNFMCERSSLERAFAECGRIESVDFIDCDFSNVLYCGEMFCNTSVGNLMDLTCFDQTEYIYTYKMFTRDDEYLMHVVTHNSDIIDYFSHFVVVYDSFDSIPAERENVFYEYRFDSAESVTYIDFPKDEIRTVQNEYTGLYYQEWFHEISSDNDFMWFVVFDTKLKYISLYITVGKSDNFEIDRFKLIDYGEFSYSNMDFQWKKYNNIIVHVTLCGDASNAEPLQCDLDYWFSDMPNLEGAEFIFLNFEGYTDMSMDYCFLNDISLERFMFNGMSCTNLHSMNNCFENCSSLKEIDLSYLDETKPFSCKDIFKNCSQIETCTTKNTTLINECNKNGIAVNDSY